jgi:PAS domain S-box-containing protein
MHPLFARQLAKATDASGKVDLDALGKLVSAAYGEADRDRTRMDRSMSLMIEELDQARARLLDAFEVMPEGLALFDAENRYVLWNSRYAELHAGIFDKLAVGMRFEDVVADAVAKGRYPEAVGREREWLDERLRAHSGSEASREYRLPNDRWLRVDERRTADGGSIGVRVDITDLKRREESFRLLFDANPIPMWIWDHETFRYLAVNDAAIEHYGYTREQFLKLTLFDLHLPAEHEALREIVRIRKSGDRAARNWSHIKADGSVVLATSYSKFWTFDGREASLVAAIDCTERNRAEAQLRQTREFLDAVVENVPTPIVVKDPDSLRYVLINRAGEQYFGLPRAAMIGKTASEALDESGAALVNELDRQALATRQQVTDEHTLKTPGAGVKQAASKRVPIISEDGTIKYLLVVIEDVTQRRTVEQQLQQAQKMEAVGNLSGGVAHDFNNLLTVIIGNLDLLKDDVEGNEAAEQKLEAILESSLHGATLTHQLLAFSRRQPLRSGRVDLPEAISKIVQLMSRTLGENIVLEDNTAADCWPVQTDAHQLESAIVNIAINARDAMPGGGRLSITTKNVQLTPNEAAAFDLAQGDYAAIEIRDNGNGMTQDTLNRVFEPFYTTKQPGKGTGLGLSMVYGFVKQSGGHITVTSELGLGTAFTLYFRRSMEAADAPAARGTENATRKNGKYEGVILAVDDNPQVQATAVLQLQQLGYRVIKADNAAVALEILDSSESIDLLFTDIVMPGEMNGKQLAAEALKRRPELRVLFTSGYPGVMEDKDGIAETDFALLAKPYRRSDLERAVREALNRGQAEQPLDTSFMRLIA